MNPWKKKPDDGWKNSLLARQPMPWPLDNLLTVMQSAVRKRLRDDITTDTEVRLAQALVEGAIKFRAIEWPWPGSIKPTKPTLHPITEHQWRIWTGEFIEQAERLGGSSDAETYEALLNWIDEFLETINSLTGTNMVGLQQEYLADIDELINQARYLDWMGDLVDPDGYY
jgi:hypothetical protein